MSQIIRTYLEIYALWMVVLDCLLIERLFFVWRVIIYQYEICYNGGNDMYSSLVFK